ncbi:hypothetical protein LINPERPRIM_LOCUS32929, partial [Linum perenne]
MLGWKTAGAGSPPTINDAWIDAALLRDGLLYPFTGSCYPFKDQTLCARLCHTNDTSLHCPFTGSCYPFKDQTLCARLCHTK